jgi:heme-degrading monooxygenase HmoA
MYVQVVSYGLDGIGEDEYFDVANNVAPRFAGMSGLLAKLWLGNSEEGRYGAVYLWEDREAMERFVRSDLFEAFNPEFDEIAVEDFDVLENLTALTQPVLQVLEPKRQPPGRAPRPTPSRTTASAPAISSASGAKGAKGAKRAKKVPVANKAATKAPKKTTPASGGRAKKVASTAKKTVGVSKKAATTSSRKTAKRAR